MTRLLEIKSNLSVRANETSRARRLKTCARDDRPSTKAIGVLGGVLIGIFVFLIVASDISSLLSWIRILYQSYFGGLTVECAMVGVIHICIMNTHSILLFMICVHTRKQISDLNNLQFIAIANLNTFDLTMYFISMFWKWCDVEITGAKPVFGPIFINSIIQFGSKMGLAPVLEIKWIFVWYGINRNSRWTESFRNDEGEAVIN